MATHELRVAGRRFTDVEIESIITETGISLSGEEFKADVLEASVFCTGEGSLINASYASEVSFYNDGILSGKYYLKSVERTGVSRYRIYATSMIGILGDENFYGAFYGNNVSIRAALGRIIGGDGLDSVMMPASPSGFLNTVYGYFIPYGAVKWASYIGTNNGYGVKINGVEHEWDWKEKIVAEFSVGGAIVGASSGHVDYTVGTYCNDELSYSDKYKAYSVGVKIGDEASTGHYISIVVQYSNQRLEFFSDGGIVDVYQPNFRVEIDPSSGFVEISTDYNDGSNMYSLMERAEIVAEDPDLHQPVSLLYAFGAHYSVSGERTYIYGDYHYKEYRLFASDGEMLIDAKAVTYVNCRDNGTSTTHSGVINCAAVSQVDSYLEPFDYGTYLYRGDVLTYPTSYLDPFDCGEDIKEAKYISRYVEFFSNLEFGEGVAQFLVRGWIPICNKRDAIYQILFSQNLSMIKTDDGKMLITGLTGNVSGEIGGGETYDTGKEEVIQSARTISLTEHSYEPQNGTEVIFDNSSSPLSDYAYIAVFKNQPINGSITASGITISRYNCNCAVCTGRGTLSGKPYRHSQNVIQSNSGSTVGSDINVSNATLVTSINSDNVLKKLSAYYSGKLKRIGFPIVYGGQRCGLNYSFTSPFREDGSGFIVKMSSNASSFVKSECEFISGFEPPDIGGYTGFEIIHYDSATWQIPESVFEETNPKIRINIIGRGLQGSHGETGERGAFTSNKRPGKGGKGGKGGAGGLGGQIYTVTVNVTSSMSRVVFSRSGNNSVVKIYGTGSSALATYSSSSGVRSASGFTNVFTGIIYALPGNVGYDGGAGGDGGFYSQWDTEVVAQPGESVAGKSGGKASKHKSLYYHDYDEWDWWSDTYFYGGNGGGGASYSNKGGDAEEQYTGGGADGGNPAPNRPEFGCGGNGGNGGGGSGGAKVIEVTRETGSGGSSTEYNNGAFPGNPGIGGDGAMGNYGCAIIYY